MEDFKVSKVGVNILVDVIRLCKVFGVNMVGVFEVSYFYNFIYYCRVCWLGLVLKIVVFMGK